MYCSNCGQAIVEGARFCASCASPVTERPIKASGSERAEKRTSAPVGLQEARADDQDVGCSEESTSSRATRIVQNAARSTQSSENQAGGIIFGLLLIAGAGAVSWFLSSSSGAWPTVLAAGMLITGVFMVVGALSSLLRGN